MTNILHPVALLEPQTRLTVTGVTKADGIDNPFVDGVMARAEQLKGQTLALSELLVRLLGRIIPPLMDKLDHIATQVLSRRGGIIAVCNHHISQKVEAIPGPGGKMVAQPMNALVFGAYQVTQDGQDFDTYDELTITFEESLLIIT